MIRTSLLILPIAVGFVLSPIAEAGNWDAWRISEDVRGEHFDFETRSSSNGLGLFYEGPAWFRNVLPGSRSRTPFSASFMIDRAGDRVSTEAGYVGTLRDVFDVGLFDNISTFVGPSSGKTSTTSIADIGSIYYYTGVLNSDWSNDATWNPGAGYPNAIGDVATNELSVSTNVFQDVGAGVTVGTIFHNPASPANAGPGVDWLITTSNPITLNEDSDGAGSAQLSNAQSIKINSLTIDGPGGLILADNLIITNANPNGGVINIATSISGAGKNVTIVGPGTTLFNGANNFSGSTTVSSGKLVVNVDNSLGSTSSVTVNAGGTLMFGGTNATTDRIDNTAPIHLNGGTIDTAGLSEGTAPGPLSQPGLGALTLTLTNTIDLGQGNSIISFADSSGQSWAGATLRILNWTGTLGTGDGTDQVYFGTNADGLTALQLNQISFYSDAEGLNFLGTGMILSDGEVVPVPEPATWIGGMFVFATLVVRQLRKRSRTAARPLAS